ncbi:unnamed protein product [Leuciscus chuanchicus]
MGVRSIKSATFCELWTQGPQKQLYWAHVTVAECSATQWTEKTSHSITVLTQLSIIPHCSCVCVCWTPVLCSGPFNKTVSLPLNISPEEFIIHCPLLPLPALWELFSHASNQPPRFQNYFFQSYLLIYENTPVDLGVIFRFGSGPEAVLFWVVESLFLTPTRA